MSSKNQVTGVSGAVNYVLGQGRDPKTGVLLELGPGEQSRVAWIGGTGFGFTISTEAGASSFSGVWVRHAHDRGKQRLALRRASGSSE